MSLGGAEQAALPSAPALFVSLPAGTRVAAFPLLCSQLKTIRQRRADASSHQETKGAAPPNLPPPTNDGSQPQIDEDDTARS